MVATIAVVPAAQAEPDKVEQAKTTVDRLYHQAEQASERYNDARVELEDLQADLRTLRADERRQRRQLDAVRDQVTDVVVRQYQGEGVTAMSQLVTAKDPTLFLSQLSTVSTFYSMQGQLFSSYDIEIAAMQIRREAIRERTDRVQRLEGRLAAEKAEIDEKYDEAKKVLDRLEAEERARIAAASRSGHSTRLPDNVPASGRAKVVVDWALTQLGKPYSWGSGGPNSYDCSGFTSAAWRQAGVSLPHSSRAQFGVGRRVDRNSLQPGDLVFYYSPISHVGIYIGGGRIVHAARPGVGVVISGVFSMPYTGAVRPG